jgi:hypothetical protein
MRPARDLLCAWCPASLSVPFRVPSRALSSLFTTRRFATSARPLLSKRVVRLGGWIAFPRDPTGAGPARRSLVRGARRARSPPLVPHGTASAFPVLFRARRAGDASGRPAFCAGTTGHAWGATRRRPRSIRPMSAAHRFCSQRTFRDAAQVSMHATAQVPTRWGSSRFTPSEPTSASQLGVRSVVFSGNRRASVPLMPRRPAGTPGGAASTGVGPQSCAFGAATSGRPEGLGRLHQAA